MDINTQHNKFNAAYYIESTISFWSGLVWERISKDRWHTVEKLKVRWSKWGVSKNSSLISFEIDNFKTIFYRMYMLFLGLPLPSIYR